MVRTIRIPRYVTVASVVGTIAGGIAILKSYMQGGVFEGKEECFGKTVIITGANTGLGKETALELAKRGGRIIMACRDMKKCEKVQKEIMKETNNINIHCKKLDLASQQSIRNFCEDIHSSEKRLDILINNAGVMRCPKMLTEDGIEMQIGVNHFGHFLLTMNLLDLLALSAPSRIINLSSISHKFGTMNFDDLNSVESYKKSDAYSQSKLANLLFTRELAKRLGDSPVTVYAVHPGIVKTELGRHMSISNSYLSSFVLYPFNKIVMKPVNRGCQTTLYCALDSALENVTGKYYSDCKEKEPAEQAMDDEAAKRLWAISEAWTKISIDDDPKLRKILKLYSQSKSKS